MPKNSARDIIRVIFLLYTMTFDEVEILDLVKVCLVRKYTTKNALKFLEKNNIKISQHTYKKYKELVIQQQYDLENYAINNIQYEQLEKIETKKSILKECWKLYEDAQKIFEKLNVLKTIEKISDTMPEVVWYADNYEKIRKNKIKKRQPNPDSQKDME